MTLYFISLGLYDEKDISLKSLETARNCDVIFAEFYTQKMDIDKEKLEELIGKKITILTRKQIEENPEIILEPSKSKKVGFMVGGDAFIATTHNSLRIEAMKQGINTKVIHGSSIVSAVGETGLHIYRFGAISTVPFPEKVPGKLPESVYDVVKMNRNIGLHTLLLMDIDLEHGKMMSPIQAMRILLKIEDMRKEGVFTKDSHVVVFARAGSDKPLIVYEKVEHLLKKKFDIPAVLIVPGVLHFTEKEYLNAFRVVS